MDTRHLEEIFPNLLEHLHATGYSKGYIANLKVEFNWIINHSNGNTWESYHDIYLERAASTSSKGSRNNRHAAIAAFERFDTEGIPPNGNRTHPRKPRGAYHKLLQGFKEIVDYYTTHEEAIGKKAPETIQYEVSLMACFLYAMQVKGHQSLSQITEEDIVSYFCDTDGKPTKSGAYARKVAAALVVSADLDPECKRIALMLPRPRDKRKNIQYLTQDEVEAVKRTLESDESGLSLRDRAIGMLLMFTGLRRSDVASMRTDSLDWEHDRITLQQSKTSVLLELPLRPVVGNAIYDYLTKERPTSSEPWLFLEKKAPHTRLNNSTISLIANQIFRLAGVRQAKGDRKGTHIFRHHAATSMLASGVARPVISESLGHTSSDSLDPYLHADFVHLKECALSIERFPVSEEVFNI